MTDYSENLNFIQKMLKETYERSPPTFNGIDLFFTGPKEIFQYCRLVTNSLLLWHENIEEKPLMFQQIIFVISDFDNIEVLQDLENRYNNSFKRKEISTKIKFVTLSDNYVSTVENFISTLDTRIPKAVIIINSENLAAISQSIDYKNIETDDLNYRTDIDILYKNIANTVYELSGFIKEKNIYMLLDSNLYSPHDTQLANVLSQLENLTISGITQEVLHEEKELSKNIQRIMTLISNNQLEEAINSILAIEDDWIKIQLLYKVEHIGQRGYFYIHIRELLEKLQFTNKSPRIYLKLAEIASYCSYSQMCIDFLNKAIFITEDDLEIAYDLARKHDAITIFDKIVNKLRQSYPRSNKLLVHDVNIYIKNEDYEQAIQLLTKQDYHKTFAEKISFLTQMIDLKNGITDYWQIIKELPNNYYEPAFEILFNHAINKKFYDDASKIIDLYEEKEGNLKNATHLRIKLLIDYFFCDKENKDDIELIQYIIRNIIKYISNNINDCYARDYFFAFLDDKTHHAYKLSILINLVVTEFQQIKQISNIQEHKVYIDDRLLEETAPKALNYLEKLPTYIVGTTKIPRDLLPENAEKCKQLSNNLLGYLSSCSTAELHEQTIEGWYLLIILLNSIATYYPDLVDDIKLFERLCSDIYITDPQRCRDHIDQICYMSGDNQVRQQNAWFAVSDLYHKMNYQQYALTALMCGLYNHPNMSYDLFYKSSNILVKLLRDMKLSDKAQNVLSFNRKIMSECNNDLYLVNKHYLDFLELTIKFKKLLTSEFDLEILVDLMNEAYLFAINELEQQREIKQIAIILVQIVLYARSHDVHIPDNVEKILQEFDNINKGEVEYLYKTFRKVNINDLFKLYQNITDARNNRDSAYDYELLSISLKTILNDANKLNNHEDLVFAIELLTDPTLVMLNSKNIYKPLYKYTDKADAKKTLIDISIQYKIPILMLAINNNKELISLLYNENGEILSKIEDKETFLFQSFLEWKRKYPYSYKDYNSREDNNLFFNSVNHIGISQEISKKTIVILDVDLQNLVTNLLLYNNNFLGDISAITTSPSLSWLKYKLSNPTVTSGKFVSWISTAETPEAYTLKTLAENFNEDIFPKYDIYLDTDQNLPKTLTGSELLIVAAHGGVTETNNIFYSISDEGEQEQKSSDFISRFEGCGVIILFICSAGRFDQHPESRTTISFVQELLNHGCETIIAPAWPIDPMMTLKWLPIFLKNWVDQKQTINDAVFQANKCIANSYSYDPSKYLALNVYGNPLKQYKA